MENSVIVITGGHGGIGRVVVYNLLKNDNLI